MNLTTGEAFALGVLSGVVLMGGNVAFHLLFVNGWWAYWTTDHTPSGDAAAAPGDSHTDRRE